jgi:hypothetical protein
MGIHQEQTIQRNFEVHSLLFVSYTISQQWKKFFTIIKQSSLKAILLNVILELALESDKKIQLKSQSMRH